VTKDDGVGDRFADARGVLRAALPPHSLCETYIPGLNNLYLLTIIAQKKF
jgi:hypothetical protein